MEKIEIRIGGMSCVNCVNAVQKSISRVPGVAEAQVRLVTEDAVITYDPRIAGWTELQKAVTDCGYQFLGKVESTVPVDDGPEEIRLRAQRKRIAVGFAGGIPMMLAMFLSFIHGPRAVFIMAGLALPIVVYTGFPIFKSAATALGHRHLTMEVMYALGIGTALLSSLVATVGWLPHDFVFYDSVILLATFLTLGKYLEGRARGRTTSSLKRLLNLQPRTALRLQNGREDEVAISAIKPADRLRVRSGEKIPVDGRVEDGQGWVDEAMISGEPLPAWKEKGSALIAGTINRDGMLIMSAEKVGDATLLAQIIRMVREALGSKPPAQRLADRVVSRFIPILLALAALSLTGWLLLGKPLLFALTSFISILVIACPCALGLATPTALTVGIGRGAELGILIKSGDSLEKAAAVTTAVFDKTGTITAGQAAVVAVEVIDGTPAGELLIIAASLEQNSLHPLGQAIMQKTRADGLECLPCQEFQTAEGRGLSARLQGHTVLLGSRKYLTENEITVPEPLAALAAGHENLGRTVVFVAKSGQAKGLIAVSDTIKPHAASAISHFSRLGIKAVMVSGDRRLAVRTVAREVGIDDVFAEVLPAGKMEVVRSLQQRGEMVVFIGDGINDAPALAAADLGIAMGGGTDIARESGDIVLIRDDLRDAATAIALSRRVMRRIRQNLFWAFFYNILLIPLASGFLTPLLGWQMKPEFAALAMAASSVTVVSLSLLLKRFSPRY